MGDLPTGTVTFLFTEMEGSTRLLQELAESYHATFERAREEGRWMSVEEAIAYALGEPELASKA